MCKYEILTKDQPFTINNEGSIRNTEPLSHKVSHNHILSIVAYDCAMKQSAPVMVNIRVRRVCEAHVMGIPERIDYVVSQAAYHSIFPFFSSSLPLFIIIIKCECVPVDDDTTCFESQRLQEMGNFYFKFTSRFSAVSGKMSLILTSYALQFL